MNKLGVTARFARGQKTRFDEEKLRELVKQGKSRKEICEELGISKNIYRNFVAENNIETPKRKTRKRSASITKEQMEALLAQGLSREELLEKLKLKTSTYQRLLHRLGLQTKHMQNIEKVEEITKQQLEEMISRGMSNRKIAEALDISEGTVSGLFRKYKLQSSLAREVERLSKIPDKKIKELLESGKSLPEIQEMYDFPIWRLYNVIKRIGYTTPAQAKRRNMQSIKKETFLSLIARGYGRSEISKILKISPSSYQNLLKKFDIDVPQTNEYKETFKKPYEKFSDEDLKNRMVELLECKEINSDDTLCEIIDFVSDKKVFSPQDRVEIIAFMRVLERINVGLNQAKDVLGMSEVKQLEMKKERMETLQTRFFGAMDILYENNRTELADILQMKYMPDIEEEKNLAEAEKIIEITERAKETNNIASAEFRLSYLDSLKSNDKNLKSAQKYSLINLGFVDEELAGKYIFASKILNNGEYQLSEEVVPFIGIIKKSNSSSEKAINAVINIYDWFNSDDAKKNSLNSFMEKFDISDELGKALIEEFVENIYIKKPTRVLTKDDTGVRQVESVLTPKAKQEIYERHASKFNYKFLRGFEAAMQKFTSTTGSNGIKEYKEGTYKNFVNRRIAELKIIGYPDRVFAFDDTFIFDSYDPKGNH